ncbi:DUF6308 family protein [Gordonia rubripertincta]|nr:DUF6308 family protein [Gordonia rubripertincta]
MPPRLRNEKPELRRMKIPIALQTDDLTTAVDDLKRYFGDPYPGERYTGASFDAWDSTGNRDADTDRFTADDLIAISLLSVNAGPAAARTLLRDRAEEFSGHLRAIGPDRDLADEPGPLDKTWPAWQLENQLRTVSGVGLTIATKLIARKRPRLYPIWDTVVVEVLGTRSSHLVPIHATLSQDAALRQRLQQARADVGLPRHVSELRILDVIAWMQGKRDAAQ